MVQPTMFDYMVDVVIDDSRARKVLGYVLPLSARSLFSFVHLDISHNGKQLKPLDGRSKKLNQVPQEGTNMDLNSIDPGKGIELR